MGHWKERNLDLPNRYLDLHLHGDSTNTRLSFLQFKKLNSDNLHFPGEIIGLLLYLQESIPSQVELQLSYHHFDWQLLLPGHHQTPQGPQLLCY